MKPRMKLNDEYRGTGRTTEAMRSAPRGSIYVWLHGNTKYPRDIADSLDRNDLIIVGIDWLDQRRYQGMELRGLIVDHAVDITPERYEKICDARAFLRKNQS